MPKLPGKKRIRFNCKLDYLCHQRFHRQAKARGLSLSDTFRRGLELLEAEHMQAREVIQAASGET